MINFKKNIVNRACSAAMCAVVMTGCSNQDFYNKEMFEPVVYLQSSTNNQNVYTLELPLSEPSPATAYFSVGIGGSTPNPEEVIVELESDTVLFDQYNRINFVLDTPRFARYLPEERFEVSSSTVRIPANANDQYVQVPVAVNHHGLSPDSTYFIPLSIKSVSRYSINPAKKNALIRVAVKNDYARQTVQTVYSQGGTVQADGASIPSVVSANKTVVPLSGDEIRLLPGNVAQPSAADVNAAFYRNNAIVAKINADSTVSISSFANVQLEQIEAEGYNRYYIAPDADGLPMHFFDLAYRYRLPTGSGTYGVWNTVRETLRRTN